MKRTKKDILAGIKEEISSAKIIGNNTLLIKYADGREAVRLHDTDIITRYPEAGIQVLSSGGWRSVTTKARMNEHGRGFRIYQAKGKWIVKVSDKEYIFQDGIHIHDATGKVEGAAEDTGAKDNALLKRIRAYVRGIPAVIPGPCAGDCFGCQFTQDGKEALGSGHLLDHMEEGYYPGALIYNALLEKGYKNPGIIVAMNVRESITRAVYTFIKRRLAPHLAR